MLAPPASAGIYLVGTRPTVELLPGSGHEVLSRSLERNRPARTHRPFEFDTGTGNVHQASFLFANGRVLMIMAILTALTAYFMEKPRSCTGCGRAEYS